MLSSIRSSLGEEQKQVAAEKEAHVPDEQETDVFEPEAPPKEEAPELENKEDNKNPAEQESAQVNRLPSESVNQE